MTPPLGFLARKPPPSRWGVPAAILAVALSTLLVSALDQLAPASALAAVYLPGVLACAIAWGARLGALSALLSAAAFDYFYVRPVGQLTVQSSSDWATLVTFLLVALFASLLAGWVAAFTRERARDADSRRREADLAVEMARILLRGSRLAENLPTAAARLAQALELSSAAIVMSALEGDERSVAFPLRDGGSRIGTLLVGVDTSDVSLRRLQERMVPTLEGLLSAGLEREALLGGVVETAALRRADAVKTALLRAVSHDLRSPLTAISAAGEAVASPGLAPAEREELAAVIQQESRRLSRLVDNLLDLSRLEAGAAEARRDWASVEELIASAIEELQGSEQEFRIAIDRELPLVRVDAVQMERAFVNVLENARRYAGGHPVSVRALAVRGDRVIVRVADRGPGIPPEQRERVFEPFHRAGSGGGEHRGSGLGLAIARGFAEANAARLHVESLPGQGATFVFELPAGEVAGDGLVPPDPTVHAGAHALVATGGGARSA